MLAKRKMSVTDLSERVGITMANLSVLKNAKSKSDTIFIIGRDLLSIGLPAEGYFGIQK
jgi:Cro/C1-type HTH DNA-binding domain